MLNLPSSELPDRLLNWQITSVSESTATLATDYPDRVKNSVDAFFNNVDRVLRKYSIDRTEGESLLIETLADPAILNTEALCIPDADNPKRAWLAKVENVGRTAYCTRNVNSCVVCLKLLDFIKI